ncbi:MAG: hypothetical protein J0M02_08590 [Planctomycetes bacterium]|nr:hypothetical protein [Planctomycetota bacterium]
MRTVPFLLSVVAACGLGAAEGDGPEAFWPLPRPTWMQEPAGEGVRVRSVDEGMPARAIGLRPGDIALATGGMHAVSDNEFALVVRIAAARADNRGRIQRAGAQPEDVRLPAFAAWGRWGVWFDNLPQATPAGLTADRQRAWAALPLRVQLAVRTLGDAGQAAWLPNLLDLRLAADGSLPAPMAVAMPTPYLQRVADWWWASAVAEGRAQPVDDADEAMFRALHPAWPIAEAVEAGTIVTGDDELDRTLAAMAGPTPPSTGACTAVARRVVGSGMPGTSGDVSAYLGQCMAAILDPDNHGGWPYRSALIWEKPERQRMVAALIAAQETPTLAAAAAIGRIGPAVIDRDAAALSDSIARLHAASPWLAQRGLLIALHAGSMWKRGSFAVDTLSAAGSPVLTPALQTRITQAAAAGIDIDSVFTGAPGALWLLRQTWRHHATWRSALDGGRGTATALNNMVWAMATDAAALDPDHVIEAARQQAMANAEGVPSWQVDTIAAAMARGGRMPDAVSWQQASLALMRQERIAEDRRATMQREYGDRLAAYRRGEACIDGERREATPSSTTLPDGSTRSGSLVAGREAGPWKTVAGNGTVLEELGYRAGSPCGIWLKRDGAGALQWSGWVDKGSRLGWWRIRSADGGMASGWYDGRNGGARCGLWQLRDAGGRLLAAGPCLQGRAVAPWSSYDSSGKASPTDASRIQLPADPPLPAGAILPAEKVEAETQPAGRSDF